MYVFLSSKYRRIFFLLHLRREFNKSENIKFRMLFNEMKTKQTKQVNEKKSIKFNEFNLWKRNSFAERII